MFLPFCVRESLKDTYLLGSDRSNQPEKVHPTCDLGDSDGASDRSDFYTKKRPRDAPFFGIFTSQK